MNAVAPTLWQRNPVLAWREIDGEAVIISPGESVMHELNGTGSFVWELLDGRHTPAQIAALLSAEYEVSSETALRDTESLLQELAALRLILEAGMSSGPAGVTADR